MLIRFSDMFYQDTWKYSSFLTLSQTLGKVIINRQLWKKKPQKTPPDGRNIKRKTNYNIN